ncbi:MAG: ChbG/HpnK family deacetylase [Pseudomonadota bacterium]
MPANDIRLLVRADDLGSSWASNMGCLEACTNGIVRSVEVMMPCAWVAHAARLLQDHPEIDVGIHLTLTSEWDDVKWRPLTQAPSLIDGHGNFLPLLIPRDDCDRPDLQSSAWKIDDIAAEFRAQIELGKSLFPRASHISSHMTRHFRDFDSAVGDLVGDLCAEFDLKDDPLGDTVPMVPLYPKFPRDPAAREQSLIDSLGSLQPGTYIFVDHPAVKSAELRATGHEGYRDVEDDRASCLEVLTSKRVKAVVQELGIELIDYRSL